MVVASIPAAARAACPATSPASPPASSPASAPCGACAPTSSALGSGRACRTGPAAALCPAGAAGGASPPAGADRCGAAARWWRRAAGWWFGFGLHLIGLYWITEAILIEAARFWWFVPHRRSRSGRHAGAVHRRCHLGGALRPSRLAACPRAGRRLGAGRPCAPVHRHRLPLEPARQRLGVPRLARRRVHPAGGLDQHPRADSAHRPAGADAGAGPSLGALRRRGPGRLGGVRRRPPGTADAPGARPARGAGAGQRRRGPEVGPSPCASRSSSATST